MPAIASLEDLNAAKKEGLSISAMLSALCSMLYALCFSRYPKAWMVGPKAEQSPEAHALRLADCT
jgi:hypothetical protein